MKKILLSAFAISGFTLASAQNNPSDKAVIMKNSLDSFSYALGINVAQSVKHQGFSELNIAMLHKAFEDVFNNKPLAMSPEKAMSTLQEQMQKIGERKVSEEKAKGAAFLAENKKRKGVVTLPSGIQYEIITPGDPNGVKPKPVDTVRVDYEGKLIDGTEFDSSVKRGEPAEFPLNGVIRGWTEVLQLMPKGSKWKVYIPSDLAYGDRAAGASIPAGSTLIFDITLYDVKAAR